MNQNNEIEDFKTGSLLFNQKSNTFTNNSNFISFQTLIHMSLYNKLYRPLVVKIYDESL